jgi:hypothetical protein
VKERRYITLTEREASIALSEGIYEAIGRGERSEELWALYLRRWTDSSANDLARCIYAALPRRRRR